MREQCMCGACAVRVPCAHRFGNLSRRGRIRIIGHEERSERTRLRDDACDRELERLPDAKRAVYLAVDAMLKADEKRRVLDAGVCGAVVEVLLVDD